MFGRFFHPQTGEDITEDVARELVRQTQEDDLELHATAAARQAQIAAAFRDGQARTFRHGHMTAQIDARVHDYWRRREGHDFWKHELKYMLKRHPELRVEARSEKPSVLVTHKVPSRPVRGRRGRWAS